MFGKLKQLRQSLTQSRVSNARMVEPMDTLTQIETWIKEKVDYLKQGLTTVLTIIKRDEKDLEQVLDIAIQDAPKITAFLGMVANVVTSVLPNGKFGEYINDAIALIGKGIPYVKTADGVLMQLDEATAAGAATNATPVPMLAAVQELMAKSNPSVPVEVHAMIVPMIVAAQATDVKIGS